MSRAVGAASLDDRHRSDVPSLRRRRIGDQSSLGHLVAVVLESTRHTGEQSDAGDGQEQPESEDDDQLGSGRERFVAKLEASGAQAPTRATPEQVDEDEDGHDPETDRHQDQDEDRQSHQEDSHYPFKVTGALGNAGTTDLTTAARSRPLVGDECESGVGVSAHHDPL